MVLMVIEGGGGPIGSEEKQSWIYNPVPGGVAVGTCHTAGKKNNILFFFGKK